MNPNFLPSPTKSASSVFQPNGVYFGVVSRVDNAKNRVWVQVPRVFGDDEIGPTAVVGPILPGLGDRVAVQFVENKANDIVVVGPFLAVNGPRYAEIRKVTSTTRPESPAVGDVISETDTGSLLVWSGTAWEATSGGGGSWSSGVGIPSDTAGEVGDWYLNESTADLYEKTSELVWTLRINLRGPQGEQGPAGLNGTNGADGADGVDGSKWYSGTGAPSGSLGVVGDWYLDQSNGDNYEKTGSTTWTLRGNLRGPQGEQGPQGDPGPSGSAGTSLLSGFGAPAAGTGNNGDFYIDRTSLYLYGPKTGGAWGTPVAIGGRDEWTAAWTDAVTALVDLLTYDRALSDTVYTYETDFTDVTPTVTLT